jgi:very-short-patch-repair endonuclease
MRRQKVNAIKGIRAAMKNSGPNKFEQRLYNVLKTENIKFIEQYEIEGKLYDAYLPEYQTLIEFDGSFWHKESITECIYPVQKRNLKNDKIKDVIAKNNGYKLIRIKELDYITSIKKLLEQ